MSWRDAIAWPTIPPDPTGWQYFWHQLPWAVPGFLTFGVGLALCAFALYAARDPARRAFRLSFAASCLGFGCLGLVLALRAVVQDREALIFWDTYLYAPVLLLGPGSAHLLYYITGERYKILFLAIIAFWLVVVFGWIGIFRFEAFTGAVHTYPFGLYPVAGIFLKPWGIVGGLAYLFFAIPVFILDGLRTRREIRSAGFRGPQVWARLRGAVAIHVGVHLLFLCALSNLPSFLGLSVYPGAHFSFFPMLLVAYGVFRADFLDLNDLFFKKNGLFYCLNIVVGLTLICLSLAAAYGLSPLSYQNAAFPYVIFPFVSAFSVFAVGILVGGTNPGERINQWAAFSLYLTGYHGITVALHSLGIEPIVVQRLEQLCYIAFSFVAVVQLRFVFLAMGERLPRLTPLLDVIAVICAVLAPTPLLFGGYYQYSFGAIGAAGPVVDLIAASGAVATVLTVLAWRRNRHRRAPLADLLVLYIVATGLLMLSYWPAAAGLEIYPPGSLIVIPTLILAYAILRYGALPLQNQALKINNRISLFLLFVSPFFLAIYYPTIADQGRPAFAAFHMILVGAPVLLLVYQVTFLFTRPVSEQLDNIYERLDQERRAAEEARNIIARQKEDLEYEISLAQTIQQALLPRSLPDVPEVSMAFRYTPAFSVGGDFLDVHFDERTRKLGFFICDVSGHGVPAALLASMVKMSLDEWPALLENPARLLDVIQERLSGKMASHFISAIVGCLDLSSGRMITANAGHPPLLVLRANGQRESLDRKGRILLDNNFDNFLNVEEITQLSLGDSLLLYTDGIVEARNRFGTFFGEAQMALVLDEIDSRAPDELCEELQGRLYDFVGHRESLEDDLTLLAIRYG